jgi:hypothetical protein
MALYIKYGESVEVVGYTKENNHYLLCCRYPNGLCAFASIQELIADNGLPEIAAAYHAALHFDPWHKGDVLDNA